MLKRRTFYPIHVTTSVALRLKCAQPRLIARFQQEGEADEVDTRLAKAGCKSSCTLQVVQKCR